MSLENINKAKSLFYEGMEYLQENNYSNAEEKFLSALNLLPERLSIVGNLFTIYFNTNNKDELKNLLNKYKNYSSEKEILYGKAINFYFEENFTESIKTCEQLLKFDEIKEAILDLLALNYQKKNLNLKSLKILKTRLNKKKDSNIYYNIGNFFFEIGKIHQAFYYFNKSKNINRRDSSNLWNLSLSALNLGKLELGFSLYENRWLKKNINLKRKFTDIQSPSKLNEIENKKILISDEQGLGDTIQFSRFVVDLLQHTKKITFVVNSKLLELFLNLDKNINIVDYSNIISKDFEYHISLCSLPKLLNIKNKNDINFYKLSLNEQVNLQVKKNKTLNIGLCWSGNPNYPRDQFRSINFKEIEKFILKNKDVNFYKLSRDINKNKSLNFDHLTNLIDFSEKNLFEIAKVLNQFDLIVSSDTSIIHLAGILNIKSILLLNFNSDWRWFLDTEQTIWYPSVKIIKQKKLNDWDNVFEELQKILEDKKNISS